MERKEAKKRRESTIEESDDGDDGDGDDAAYNRPTRRIRWFNDWFYNLNIRGNIKERNVQSRAKKTDFLARSVELDPPGAEGLARLHYARNTIFMSKLPK